MRCIKYLHMTFTNCQYILIAKTRRPFRWRPTVRFSKWTSLNRSGRSHVCWGQGGRREGVPSEFFRSMFGHMVTSPMWREIDTRLKTSPSRNFVGRLSLGWPVSQIRWFNNSKHLPVTFAFVSQLNYSAVMWISTRLKLRTVWKHHWLLKYLYITFNVAKRFTCNISQKYTLQLLQQ